MRPQRAAQASRRPERAQRTGDGGLAFVRHPGLVGAKRSCSRFTPGVEMTVLKQASAGTVLTGDEDTERSMRWRSTTRLRHRGGRVGRAVWSSRRSSVASVSNEPPAPGSGGPTKASSADDAPPRTHARGNDEDGYTGTHRCAGYWSLGDHPDGSQEGPGPKLGLDLQGAPRSRCRQTPTAAEPATPNLAAGQTSSRTGWTVWAWASPSDHGRGQHCRHVPNVQRANERPASGQTLCCGSPGRAGCRAGAPR